MLDLSTDSKTFDVARIVEDLQQLRDDLLAATRHVEDGGAITNDVQALAIIFYVKHAMAPVVEETLFSLKKVKGKMDKSGKRKEVRQALEDLRNRVVVLEAALLRKTPENRKQYGLHVFDAIVADFQDAVNYYHA